MRAGASTTTPLRRQPGRDHAQHLDHGQTGPPRGSPDTATSAPPLSGYQAIVGWPDQPADRPVRPVHRLCRPAVHARGAAGRARPPAAYRRGLLHRRLAGRVRRLPALAAARRLLRPRHDRAARGNADGGSRRTASTPCLPDDGRDRFVAIAVCDDAHWRAWPPCSAAPTSPPIRGSPTAAGRLPRGRARRADRGLDGRQRRGAGPDALQAPACPRTSAPRSPDFCHDPQLAHRGHLRRAAAPALRHRHRRGPALPAVGDARPGEPGRADVRPGQRARAARRCSATTRRRFDARRRPRASS